MILKFLSNKSKYQNFIQNPKNYQFLKHLLNQPSICLKTSITGPDAAGAPPGAAGAGASLAAA